MAPNTTTLGFDRVEIARLMIQSLKALGYKHSAQTLATEAGCELESQAVTQFRECVLSGAWDTVEQLSEQLDIDPVEGLPVTSLIYVAICLAG
ncbi:WD repeat-containing protein 26, partial [Podila minutissima]